MPNKTPCYVSGKGMFATDTTANFKTQVMATLASTELGYDTRLAYYQTQYPDLSFERLARMICDPIEYYDKDWTAYYAANKGIKETHALTVDFFLPKDTQFRADAKVAIICFDEAGFGTGINCMRFLHANKPILGFIHAEHHTHTNNGLNLDNVYQLQQEFPTQVTLKTYTQSTHIDTAVTRWLRRLHLKNHA